MNHECTMQWRSAGPSSLLCLAWQRLQLLQQCHHLCIGPRAALDHVQSNIYFMVQEEVIFSHVPGASPQPPGWCGYCLCCLVVIQGVGCVVIQCLVELLRPELQGTP